MSTVRLHLARFVGTAVLLLLLLLAALLALGWHASSVVTHAPASISAHHATADVADPPPGH